MTFLPQVWLTFSLHCCQSWKRGATKPTHSAKKSCFFKFIYLCRIACIGRRPPWVVGLTTGSGLRGRIDLLVPYFWLPCSPISPDVKGWWWCGGGANFFSSFSAFLSKQKSKQSVNRMSETQKDRPTDRKTDEQTDRMTDRKTKRLFSLVIKTKVVQNVNRMSENIMSVCQYVNFSA